MKASSCTRFGSEEAVSFCSECNRFSRASTLIGFQNQNSPIVSDMSYVAEPQNDTGDDLAPASAVLLFMLAVIYHMLFR